MTTPRYDQTITASASGGPFAAGRPVFMVIHSTEGPMARGNAVGLAQWFARSKTNGGPGTSTTGIFDPGTSVRMLPESTIPFHVGPEGNPLSNGDEHCGSVGLTKAQWMSADAQEMLNRSAKVQAQRAHYRGWSLAECRWLSLTQVAARNVNGFCTHNDVRLALGGTTHSDPGPNFPYTWYMGRIRAWYQDPVNGGDDMPAYSDWSASDRQALVGDIIRAVQRGEMPDGSKPQHLVDASTTKIVEWQKILQVGDGASVPAASDTHKPNLKSLDDAADKATLATNSRLEAVETELTAVNAKLTEMTPPTTPTE